MSRRFSEPGRAGGADERAGGRGGSDSGSRGLQRLGELLPETARRLGLDEQLELARVMAAFELIVSERLPSVHGSCRVVALSHDVVGVEADEAIVAQELRLAAPELTAALRSAVRTPVRQLRITIRHV